MSVKSRLKGLVIIVINLPKIITDGKLFSKQKYHELIKISKKWLNKKGDSFLPSICIAYLYAHLGKSDEGFEYVKGIIQNTSSDSLVEKFLRYFVYPEFKKKNYDKIIHRCSYFINEKITQKTGKKIDKIISDAGKLGENTETTGTTTSENCVNGH